MADWASNVSSHTLQTRKLIQEDSQNFHRFGLFEVIIIDDQPRPSRGSDVRFNLWVKASQRARRTDVSAVASSSAWGASVCS
jgi:hypothetical protein